jgi:hypothetical protein
LARRKIGNRRKSSVLTSTPASVEMERLTIDWIRQILGFNPAPLDFF